ncbi:fatty acid desaturase family protein [Microbispora sp. NPDC088329]|uniref:fatty acid desaturase family protein n=1 Tax=Microbispora sp. NPDC088329 TaxID=3154869 RepID=UPI00341A7FDC
MSSTIYKNRLPAASPEPPSAKPYHRGYTAPPELRSAIAAAHRNRSWITIGAALADHLVIYLALAATVWTVTNGWWPLSLIVVPAGLVVVGRNLRALECLIHEGSHFNLSRTRRRANDVLTFVLCGLPAGIIVADYRASHLLHHGRFGGSQDPDRQRYIELDLEPMRRDDWRMFLMGLSRRLPRYQIGWLRAIGADRLCLAMPLGWALIAVGAPFWALAGPHEGIVAAVVWLGAYLLVLPVIRFLAESSEHVYSDATTVFDATISNLGRMQRLLLHAHNDGYHTVHHMWPGVPHHALRKLHELLLVEDPDGYGARLRFRTRFLQEPQTRPGGPAGRRRTR